MHGDSDVPDTPTTAKSFGDEAFQRNVEKAVQQPCRVTKKAGLSEQIARLCEELNTTTQKLCAPDRNRVNARLRAKISHKLVRDGTATIAELARFFHRSEPVILRAIQRHCRKGNLG